MRKLFLAFFIVVCSVSLCNAAGGEINGVIIQKNKMKNSKAIGVQHDMVINNIFGDDVEINSGKTSINTIVNTGRLSGIIYQDHEMINSTTTSISNKLENDGEIRNSIQQTKIRNSKLLTID